MLYNKGYNMDSVRKKLYYVKKRIEDKTVSSRLSVKHYNTALKKRITKNKIEKFLGILKWIFRRNEDEYRNIS